MTMPIANTDVIPIQGLGSLLARCWPIGIGAFVVTLIATPLCRRFAIKNKIVDKPDEFLKPHGRPIPYLGGVAIFLGWGTGLAVAYWRLGLSLQILTFLAAGLFIMLLGLLDDLHALKPKSKLIGNILVAVWLMVFGLGTDAIRAATDLAHVKFDTPLEQAVMLVYSIPITLFVVVGSCNATNLIDGLDGLCSGVFGIISIGFLVLAIHLALIYPGQVDANAQRVALSLAMLGAAIGFLPYNRNPATIFMGDAGSMLLGLNAAMLILLFAQAGIIRWLIGALIVFGLPVADMMLTLVRRWRNAKPLMQGDRSHFYDQLIDRGLNVRQVVAISYGVSILFAIFGCLVIFLRTMVAVLVYFAFVVTVILIIARLRMVNLERAGVDGAAAQPDPDALGQQSRGAPPDESGAA